jgi:hypothetical protein
VTETWVETLLAQCDLVLVNDAPGLETFHARYEAEVLPRLATHFTQRVTVSAR